MDPPEDSIAAAESPAGPIKFFKLPDFWASSPAAWFGIVESHFRMRGVTSQLDRFSLVTAVLPEASARRVRHLLTTPGDDCYDVLRAALLTANQLTSYQKAELLFSAEPLGDRRPSELLSELMELVRPGEERSHLFAMLFLRRLPAPIRLLLTEDDHEDVQALAEKADRCAASLHKQQVGSLCSSMAALSIGDASEVSDGGDFSIAALSSGRQRGGFQRQQSGGRQQRSTAQQLAPSPATLSQQAAGLCWFHFTFGAKANKCRKPCAWQGN